MKKRIYLATIWIITIACITIGTLFHVFNFGQNSRWFNWMNSGNNITDSNYIENYDETIDTVIIDLKMADISIVKGSRLGINYTCSEKLVPSLNYGDGTLYLTQNNGTSISPFGKTKCDIVLTIPENMTIKNMEIALDMGDINLSNITADNFNIECNMGDIDISRCSLGTSDITNNMGDCDIENSTFQTLGVKIDMGDIDISGYDLSDYAIDASCSMGDIEVNGHEYGTTFKQDGTGTDALTIKNSMGDIELEY